MRNVVRLTLVALVAVICLGALTAAGASAAEDPLFITGTGEALLFTSTSGTVKLRSKELGIEGTVACEKTLIDGFALTESVLARELHIALEGKCEQTIGSEKAACTEPIKPLLSYGLLGLLNRHVVMLVASEKGAYFVEVKCGANTTKFGGAVIGEFPLNGRGGGLEYGVALEDFLLLFKAKGITQEPEEIELSGTLMTGVGLTAEGFFGGKASLESTELLEFDGLAEIQRVPLQHYVDVTEVAGAKCTIVNKEVEFKAVNESCEFEARNNQREKIVIAGLPLNLSTENPPSAECRSGLAKECTRDERPVNGPRCEPKTELEPAGMAGSKCFIKLQYIERPRRQRKIQFIILAVIEGNQTKLGPSPVRVVVS